MTKRPRFRVQYRLEPVGLDRVLLVHEGGRRILHGLLAQVAPLIDGHRSVAEISEQLDAVLTPLDVAYALELLEEQGLVVFDAEPAGDATGSPLIDALGVDPSAAHARLQKTSVAVTTLCAVEPSELSGRLARQGVRIAQPVAADLLVVLAADYLDPRLKEFNSAAAGSGRPWLALKPAGMTSFFGPLFVPATRACLGCLQARLARNRPELDWLRRPGTNPAEPLLPARAVPSVTDAALSLAATIVHRWVVTGALAEFEGALVSVDPLTLTSRRHQFVPIATCGRCADPSRLLMSGRPLQLEARPKYFRSDGGHRGEHPEETWRKLEHHVSPLVGIVTECEPQGAEWANVYLAKHDLGRGDRQPIDPGLGRLRRSAGKGLTRAQARTGALCEALERYSGLYQGYEPRERASYRQLGGAAIHPNDCMLFSQGQYAAREVWNRTESDSNWVPRPFDPLRELEWTPLWSLTEARLRYLPSGYLYYGYPYADGEEFYRADSNGAAAGMTLEEAILQGLLELVERDAVAIWWYNRVRRPAVDLASFGVPYLVETVRRYRDLGRELQVLDLTTDLNVPAFVSVSRPADGGAGPELFGFGAHLEPRLGVSRAVTEMNQFLPALLGGAALPAANRAVARAYTGQLEAASFLTADEGQPARLATDYTDRSTDDLAQDVGALVARLRELGIEVLVLDQTRPETGLAVVKVVAPGLRPHWARLGQGRLYEVPVDLGWRRTRAREHEHNPCHLRL